MVYHLMCHLPVCLLLRQVQVWWSIWGCKSWSGQANQQQRCCSHGCAAQTHCIISEEPQRLRLGSAQPRFFAFHFFSQAATVAGDSQCCFFVSLLRFFSNVVTIPRIGALSVSIPCIFPTAASVPWGSDASPCCSPKADANPGAGHSPGKGTVCTSYTWQWLFQVRLH